VVAIAVLVDITFGFDEVVLFTDLVAVDDFVLAVVLADRRLDTVGRNGFSF
jgi:hypothetical protein